MTISVITGHDKIGDHNFTYWSKKPTIPGSHNVIFVPQSIYDSWEAYCECGNWMAVASSYDYPNREDVFAAFKAAHDIHKDQ